MVVVATMIFSIQDFQTVTFRSDVLTPQVLRILLSNVLGYKNEVLVTDFICPT